MTNKSKNFKDHLRIFKEEISKAPRRYDERVTFEHLREMYAEFWPDNYTVNEFNEPVIRTVVKYFSGDPNFNSDGLIIEKNKPSLSKGILLRGPNGVGKSEIFKIMHYIGKFLSVTYGIKEYGFRMISAPDFVEVAVNTNRKKTGSFDISQYYDGPLCIDELGLEPFAYGNKDIVGPLIFERCRRGSLTFVTTNKTLTELTERHGPAIGDRFTEMCNIIKLDGKSFR